MNTDKVILKDSPESATFRTDISGWVSAKGHFYGKDESLARYDGSTHKPCTTCGKLSKKEWAYDVCNDCLHEKQVEKIRQRETVPYNPETPVVIANSDIYFFDEESLWEHLSDSEAPEGSILLEVCEPQYLNEINSEIWERVLPMDGEVEDIISKEVLDLVDQLNAKIREHPPVSWIPGKKVTVYHFNPDQQ